MTTTAPSAASTNTIPASVKDSETAFSDRNPRFPLAVDDVQGIEQRLHRGVGTPKGNPETDDEGRSESPASLRGDPRELVPGDVHRAAGQESGELVQMSGNRCRIGEQAVDRDEGCKRGKDRQQAVVGHARGQRQDAVLGNVGVDPQQNVLPSARRDLRGRARLPAAVVFACRLGSSRVVGPVSQGDSSAGGVDMAAFFREQYGSQGRCHQESHRRDDGPLVRPSRTFPLGGCNVASNLGCGRHQLARLVTQACPGGQQPS